MCLYIFYEDAKIAFYRTRKIKALFFSQKNRAIY